MTVPKFHKPGTVNGKWNYTPGADVDKGDIVDFTNNGIGIALDDIDSGDVGAVARGGVWEVDKDTNLAISQGDKLYWDSVNSWFDKTSSSQSYAGIAEQDAATTATRVYLDLCAYIPDQA